MLKFSVFGKWVSMDELIFALIAFVGFAFVCSHLFVLLDVLKLGISPFNGVDCCFLLMKFRSCLATLGSLGSVISEV